MNKVTIRKKLERKIQKESTPWLSRAIAMLGDGSGNVLVDGEPGMVYARVDNGQVIEVFNDKVPAENNRQVEIGIDRRQPGLWQVIRIRRSYGESVDTPFTVFHHEQHEYPNADTVFVRRDQFTPLLVLPAGGMSVRIFGDVIYRYGMTAPIKVENTDVDLSSYVPVSGALWLLIEALEDGTINYVEGDTVASLSVLEFTPLPVPSPDAFPICAISLYNGQTSIRRDDEVRHIVDLRQFISDVTVDPLTSFSGFDEKVTVVEDDYVFGLDSENSNAGTKWLWSTIKDWLISIADAIYATVGHDHDADYAPLVHTHTSSDQYRQFLYEVSGGTFTFVVDEEGNPVTVLEDLE